MKIQKNIHLKAGLLGIALIMTFLAGCAANYPEKPAVTISQGLSYFVGDFQFDDTGTPLIEDIKNWLPYKMPSSFINHGKETYLIIRKKLPEKEVLYPVVFIPSGSYWHNFEVYLDRERMYQSVVPVSRPSEFDHMRPHLFKIPDNFGNKTLYFRFYSNRKGPLGLEKPIFIDFGKSIIFRIVLEQIDRLILGFIFIFTALISLLIFLKNWRRKYYSVFSFFLMSMAIGIFVIASSDLTMILFSDTVSIELTAFLAVIFFPIGLFKFIEDTIGPGYKSIIRRSWQLFIILSIPVIPIFIFWEQVNPYIPFLAAAHIRTFFFVLSIVAAIIELIRSLIKGSREARIISFGLLIFGFSIFGDIILKAKSVSHQLLYFHWGYFILMILLGYLIYKQFEESQRKLRIYSEELEEKSHALQDLNRTLEEKVEERTEELKEMAEELIVVNDNLVQTNHLLADRNQEMENEIIMARQIQQRLIPASDPLSSISSLYRPMELVGGDFYDFFKFRDSDKIGIFISDVSGHGIPAALITSMVKTIILQAGSRREDPALLFSYINEILYDQTDDNFITAFYGILDKKTNSLNYANAGHNPPFIISGKGITPIEGFKTPPIACMNNNFLEEHNKFYQNNHIELPPNCKLLLYTDGLTEAAQLDNETRFFENNGMMDILEMHKELPCRDFVKKLFDEVSCYRGSDSFEDDVCIICVDL